MGWRPGWVDPRLVFALWPPDGRDEHLIKYMLPSFPLALDGYILGYTGIWGP